MCKNMVCDTTYYENNGQPYTSVRLHRAQASTLNNKHINITMALCFSIQNALNTRKKEEVAVAYREIRNYSCATFRMKLFKFR